MGQFSFPVPVAPLESIKVVNHQTMELALSRYLNGASVALKCCVNLALNPNLEYIFFNTEEELKKTTTTVG